LRRHRALLIILLACVISVPDASLAASTPVTVTNGATRPIPATIQNTPNVAVPGGVAITNTPSVNVPNGVEVTNKFVPIIAPEGVEIFSREPIAVQGLAPRVEACEATIEAPHVGGTSPYINNLRGYKDARCSLYVWYGAEFTTGSWLVEAQQQMLSGEWVIVGWLKVEPTGVTENCVFDAAYRTNYMFAFVGGFRVPIYATEALRFRCINQTNIESLTFKLNVHLTE